MVTSIFKSNNEDLQRVDHMKVTVDKYQPVKNALQVSAYLPYAHNASLVLDSGKLLRKTHFFWTYVDTVFVSFVSVRFYEHYVQHDSFSLLLHYKLVLAISNTVNYIDWLFWLFQQSTRITSLLHLFPQHFSIIEMQYYGFHTNTHTFER